MPSHYSAYALALFSLSSQTLALFSGETCPPGYEREVTPWINCGANANANDPTQCATIDVPLDYSDPTNEAKTLRIPMVRFPRKDEYANEERYAIFFNPGGPGGSGVASVAGGSFVWDITGGKYDVVGFDPRGVALSDPFYTSTNQSTNYECPSTDSVSPFETDAQLTAAVSAAKTQASSCASNPDGESLGDGPGSWGKYIGTAWVARDIVAMSNAINPNKQVRYYGASYGTLLGATLAAMFPEKMERIVIDGNINPLDYYFGDGSETPAAADLCVSHFFDECAKNENGKCALNTGNVTGVQLQSKWDAYLAKLYDEDMNNWYSAKGQMNSALKTGPSKWVQYAKDLQSAWTTAGITRRDQISASGISGAAAQAAETKQEPFNVLNAVACGDYQGRASNPPTLDVFRTTRNAWKQSSKYMYDQYLTLQFQCDAWETDAIEQFKYPASGNNPNSPVLLVNSLYDPVTPLLSANHSRDTFASGKAGVLMSAGAGHVSNAQNVDTLNAQIKSYLDSGNLPDTSQIYTTPKNAFDEDQSSSAETQTDAGQTTTKKRDFVFPAELMNAPSRSVGLGRRDLVPVGCQPINGTSITSTTSVSTSTSSGTATTTSSPFTYTGSLTFTPSGTSNFPSTYTGPYSFSTSTPSGFSFTFSTPYTYSTSIPTSSKISTPSFSFKVSPTYTASTASVKPASNDWGSWISTARTPAASTWATWKPTTTPAIDPDWSDWGSWSYSTVVSTVSKCPPFVPGCQDVVTTKTVSYKNPYPTVTVYTTAFVNVCPTGLATSTVTLTATCKDGCSIKPTGVPAGYTVTSVWCSACTTPTFVAVTTTNVFYDPAATWNSWSVSTVSSKKPDASSIKVSSGAPAAATWTDWDPAATSGKAPDASSKTTSGGAWTGVMTPAAATGSGIIKPYTGAATQQVVGLGGLVLAVLTTLFLL